MACAAECRTSDQLDATQFAHQSEAGGPLSLKELVKALAKVVRNKTSTSLQNATEAQSLLRCVEMLGVAGLHRHTTFICSRYDASQGEWKRFALTDANKNYSESPVSLLGLICATQRSLGSDI